MPDEARGEDTTSAPLSVAHAASLLDRLLLTDEEPQATEPQPEGDKPEGEVADEEVVDSELTDDLEDGESDDIADEEAEVPAKPELHRVKDHDGKEIEVSTEELKAGFMQRADYTRKTQAVAEEKKQVAAEKAGDARERVALASKLKALDDVLKEQTGPEPDWVTLRKEMKTEEFNATWIGWQEHQKKLDVVAQARQKADKDVFEDQKRAYETHVTGEQEKLIAAIPEWKDPAKMKAEMTKMVTFAVNVLGYTREELATVVDHRVIQTVRDAQRYHELMAKRPDPKKQGEKASKEVVAPTGGDPEKKPVSKLARANMRLAKTGTVQDAAAALLAIPGLIE